MLTRRSAQAARSERGVQRPEDDLARLLPGVAAGRAHRRAPTATPGCASCCAPTAQGLDTDAALKTALEHRLRPAAGRLRPDCSSSSSARCARALAAPEDGEKLRACRSTSCKAYAGEHPRSFPVQMALGAALRKAGAARRGDAGVRAGGGAGAACRAAPTARTSRWPRSRWRRRIPPRAITELTALVARRLQQRRGGAAAGVAAAPGRRRRCRRSCAPVYAAHRRDRSVRRRRARDARPPGAAAQRRRRRGARVPHGRRARPGRSRRRAHRSRRELLQGAASAPKRKKQTLAALEIAPSYERAQDLLLKRGRRRQVSRRGLAASRAGRSALSTLVPASSLQPARRRAAAGARRRSLRRPAVALRAHQVPLRRPKARGVPQDFYGEPWGIDAPAAEQNLSRRIKTATAIQVEDPIVLTLDDPRLFEYPWIYFVEPGSLRLQRQRGADPARVPAARRHGDVRRFSRPARVGQLRAAR